MPKGTEVHVAVEVESEVSAAEWDEAIGRSDDTWLFHTAGWIELTARVWPLRNWFFVVRRGGRIVGGLAVQLAPGGRRPWVRPQAYSIWMGTGGPFAVRDLDAKARHRVLDALTEAVRQWAAQEGLAAVHCALPPLAPNNLQNARGINPLVPFGWQDTSTHTRIRSLSQGCDLFDGLDPDARRLCRRAVEAGYRVAREDWSEALDRYYELHQETYRRTGATPHPREYFEGIARTMGPRGHAVLWGCRNSSGQLVAFHNCGRYGQGAVYWTGCSQTADAKAGVNYLLMAHAIRAAAEEGFRYYDLGEAFPGTSDAKLRGLDRFKGKFGGQMYRFFRGRIDLPRRRPWPLGAGRKGR
ncbi:MAG TPA: GNAT family N-acetyltransferase [Planctomycetes bacterium]|nr:GNAT family N-acetyltransferase [Planctomycetota bacterium]